MKEDLEQQIKRQAKEIRDKVLGNTLYGQPIDPGDNDMVLVATYYYALSKRFFDKDKVIEGVK